MAADRIVPSSSEPINYPNHPTTMTRRQQLRVDHFGLSSDNSQISPTKTGRPKKERTTREPTSSMTQIYIYIYIIVNF